MTRKQSISPKQAVQLFYDLQEFNLNFQTEDPVLQSLQEADLKPVINFPFEGCYARSEAQVRFIRDKGIEASKTWLFSPNYFERKTKNADRLSCPNPYHKGLFPKTISYSYQEGLYDMEKSYTSARKMNLSYHVAPVVNVEHEGAITPVVLDPTFHERPVTYENQDKFFGIKDKNRLRVTTAFEKGFNDPSAEFIGNWDRIKNDPSANRTMHRLLLSETDEPGQMLQSFQPQDYKDVGDKLSAFQKMTREITSVFYEHQTAVKTFKLRK